LADVIGANVCVQDLCTFAVVMRKRKVSPNKEVRHVYVFIGLFFLVYLNHFKNVKLQFLCYRV